MYKFNKVRGATSYDYKGQHFEKWGDCPSGYECIRQHFDSALPLTCVLQSFS